MNVKMLFYGVIMLIVFIALWNFFYRIWQIACLIDKTFSNKTNQAENTKTVNSSVNNTNKNTTAKADREYTQKKNTQSEYTQRQYTGSNNTPKKEEPGIPECLVVLGFTKEPDNKDDIRTRYKKLSKIYHPDMGGTQEEFQRINKAWESARKIYDIK